MSIRRTISLILLTALVVPAVFIGFAAFSSLLSSYSELERTSMIERVSVLAGLGAIFLIATYVALHKRLVRRVQTLQEDAGAIASSGDFSLRLRTSGSDEIARLGESVNVMLAKLEETHSEALKTRQDAERANRAKSSFLAKVSHELRTPIFSVQGYLRILKKADLNSKAADNAAKVEEAADRLLTVVNSILDFAELSSTELRLRKSRCNLPRLLRDVAALQGAMLRTKPDVQFTMKVSAALPHEIFIDEERFTQVIMHLLSNALKFTEKGKVELSVMGDPGGIVVVIQDTGIGMTDEHLARAYEAFEQNEDVGNRRFDGLGLGVTLCRMLVDAFGGTLSFDSELGRGTTVRVFIPVDFTLNSGAGEKVDVVFSNSAAASDTVPKKLRVLIADDEKLNLMLLRHMVEDLGHEVHCVDDGVQMVDAFTNSLGSNDPVAHFDVVLTDLEMPHMNGVEAIKRIRKAEQQAGVALDKQIPILVVTAHGRSKDAAEAREVGSTGFVLKPIEPEQLSEAIKGVLRKTGETHSHVE